MDPNGSIRLLLGLIGHWCPKMVGTRWNKGGGSDPLWKISISKPLFFMASLRTIPRPPDQEISEQQMARKLELEWYQTASGEANNPLPLGVCFLRFMSYTTHQGHISFGAEKAKLSQSNFWDFTNRVALSFGRDYGEH